MKWFLKKPLPKSEFYAGIVGCGHFAQLAYVPALNLHEPPIICSGLYSRSIQSARDVRDMLVYKSRVFPRFEDLINSGIKAAIIVAPNNMHYRLVTECLNKNLDVFCEKPIANTLDHAHNLENVLKDTHRILMVGFNFRYMDVILQLKSLIDQGDIGTITAVHAFQNLNIEQHLMQSDWLNDANKSGGGVIHNAGIHFVNMLLFFLGPVADVSAEFKNLKLPACFGEDTASCKFTFKSGVRASLDASFVNAVDNTKGDIILQGNSGTMTLYLADGLIAVRDEAGIEKIIRCAKQDMDIPDSICAELRHFHSCLENRTTPITDIVDSVETLRITEAIKVAAIENRKVYIGEVPAGPQKS